MKQYFLVIFISSLCWGNDPKKINRVAAKGKSTAKSATIVKDTKKIPGAVSAKITKQALDIHSPKNTVRVVEPLLTEQELQEIEQLTAVSGDRDTDELAQFITQQVQGYEKDSFSDAEKVELEQLIQKEINRDRRVAEIIQEFLSLPDLLYLYEQSFYQATVLEQQALIRLMVQATLQETKEKDDAKSNAMLAKEIRVLQKIIQFLDIDQQMIIQKRMYRLQQLLMTRIAYLKSELQEKYYDLVGMYEE